MNALRTRVAFSLAVSFLLARSVAAERGGTVALVGAEFYLFGAAVLLPLLLLAGSLTAVVVRRIWRPETRLPKLTVLFAALWGIVGWVSGANSVIVGLAMAVFFHPGRTM